jgi:hypothetical protein
MPASLRLPLTSIQRLLAASLKHPPTPSPPSTRPLFLLLFIPATLVSLAIGLSSDSRASLFFSLFFFSSSRFGCSSGRRCQQLPSLKPQRPAARLVAAARRLQTPEFTKSKTFAHGLAHHAVLPSQAPSQAQNILRCRSDLHSSRRPTNALHDFAVARSDKSCPEPRQGSLVTRLLFLPQTLSCSCATEARPRSQSSSCTIALFPPRERF